MNVLLLQLIAMMTMLVDHIGVVFADNAIPLRAVGRLAFPIYAFLLAEGYRHCRQHPARVEAHLGGLVVLTLLSEPIYDLMEHWPMTAENALASQSVMITLLLAYLGMIALDRWRERPVLAGAAVLVTALMGWVSHSNYRFAGVLIVYLCYGYLEHVQARGFSVRLVAMLGVMAVYLAIYHWARYDFCTWDVYVQKLRTTNAIWYLMHVPAAMLLACYNGERGPRSRAFQMVYKSFYPAHMLILGMLHLFTDL